MKTLVVSVVIAMTSVFNAFSNGNLTQFAYNTTTDGEKVESQTVYTEKRKVSPTTSEVQLYL